MEIKGDINKMNKNNMKKIWIKTKQKYTTN